MTERYVRPPSAVGSVVLRDVTVVDPVGGSRAPHQDVRIEGGTIADVTATGGDDAGSTVIDLAGRYVVPGFIDAHAHPLNDPSRAAGAYALMLAHGVVGFRQMSGSAKLLADRAAGRLPVFAGAPALLATCGDLLTPMNSATASSARASVRAQHTQGADFVKAALTNRAGHLAALDEARRLGIPLAGHLPADVDPREAAALGMRSIEHLGPGATVFAAVSSDEAAIRAQDPGTPVRIPAVKIPGMDRIVGRLIANLVVNPSTRTSPEAAHQLADADSSFDRDRARELAHELVAHQTWQCPTLVRMHTQQFPDAPEHAGDPRGRYIDPRELRRWRRSTAAFSSLPQETRDALGAHWDAQLRLIRVFDEEGVPLLTGTDACGAGWVIPGFALHDEFDLLADAGLSPLAVLRATTSAAARFFGLDDVAGRVAPGYRADLVVLDADPLADHRHLHAVTGVVRDGGWWSRTDLDGVLARVEADPRTV